MRQEISRSWVRAPRGFTCGGTVLQECNRPTYRNYKYYLAKPLHLLFLGRNWFFDAIG